MPIRNVSDASGLAELVDEGVIDADRVVAVVGKTEGNGGVNDYTRIIADRAFREVLVVGEPVPGAGRADPDRVVRRYRRHHQPARDDLRDHSRRPGRADRPAATRRRPRNERGHPAGGDRAPRHDREGRRQRPRRDGGGRDHRRCRRPLRADQDAAADHRHDPRCQGPRSYGLDRAHPRVDGSVQRLHRARRGGRARRDRDADRRGRPARPEPVPAVASCSSGVELDRAQVVVVGNVRGIGAAGSGIR